MLRSFMKFKFYFPVSEFWDEFGILFHRLIGTLDPWDV